MQNLHRWSRLTSEDVRAIQLELLAELEQFCGEHGLRFYLYAGTLLGAIRHEGFIPWDDDIDVMMLREDYERLIREFPQTGASYVVSGNAVADLPFAFAKLCRTDTLVKEDTRARRSVGVSIDILPVDDVASSSCGFGGQKLLYQIARVLVWAKVLEDRDERSRRRSMLVSVTRYVLRPISVRTLIRARQFVARMSPPSGMVGMLVAEIPWRLEAEALMGERRMVFEGHEYAVPKGSEALLTQLYGAFSSPPPENDRESRHKSAAFARSDFLFDSGKGEADN